MKRQQLSGDWHVTSESSGHVPTAEEKEPKGHRRQLLCWNGGEFVYRVAY